MLDAYEASDFAESIERDQRGTVLEDYDDVVRSVRATFHSIRRGRSGR